METELPYPLSQERYIRCARSDIYCRGGQTPYSAVRWQTCQIVAVIHVQTMHTQGCDVRPTGIIGFVSRRKSRPHATVDAKGCFLFDSPQLSSHARPSGASHTPHDIVGHRIFVHFKHLPAYKVAFGRAHVPVCQHVLHVLLLLQPCCMHPCKMHPSSRACPARFVVVPPEHDRRHGSHALSITTSKGSSREANAR